MCGAIFSNLSKTGVEQPSGDTSYYATPEAAASAASAQLPSADALLGPDVLTPSTSTPSLPRVMNPEPTTKAKVLQTLLNGGLSALAASGSRSAGEGAFRALQFQQGLSDLRDQADVRRLRDLQAQHLAAETAALPAREATQNAETQARTNYYRAGIERRGKFLVPGVGLVDENGAVLVEEPGKGKALDNPDERRQFIDTNDPKGHLLSGSDRLGYIATGKWPQALKERGPSLVGWIEDANSPNPEISGPAQKNLDKYRNVMHPTKPGENEGLSASDARLLHNDPQYTGFYRRYAALADQYGKLAAFDPEGAQGIASQMDDLAGAMDQRKTQLLGAKGGLRLKKKSSGIELKPSHGSGFSQTQSYMGHTYARNSASEPWQRID